MYTHTKSKVQFSHFSRTRQGNSLFLHRSSMCLPNLFCRAQKQSRPGVKDGEESFVTVSLTKILHWCFIASKFFFPICWVTEYCPQFSPSGQRTALLVFCPEWISTRRSREKGLWKLVESSPLKSRCLWQMLCHSLLCVVNKWLLFLSFEIKPYRLVLQWAAFREDLNCRFWLYQHHHGSETVRSPKSREGFGREESYDVVTQHLKHQPTNRMMCPHGTIPAPVIKGKRINHWPWKSHDFTKVGLESKFVCAPMPRSTYITCCSVT